MGGPGALPAAPDVDGIAFLEFAVDDAAREALAAMLVGMGFHLAGRHRSKAVALYRQGGIAFVLNSEQGQRGLGAFSASRAIGLRHGAAGRRPCPRPRPRPRTADPRLAGAAWPGRAAIPAVRGPDGTLIYLVGRDAPGRIFGTRTST